MKKLLNKIRCNQPFLRFNLKINLILLFLFTGLSAIHANNLYSQNTKISLNEKNIKISKIIEIIETETEFKFVYNIKSVDLDKSITIKVKDESIETILKIVFNNSNTAYKISGKQIILKEKKKTVAISEPAVSPIQNKINGQVVDENGNAVPGVNVTVKGTKLFAQTDIDGKYTIIASGNDILLFSYIGYMQEAIAINGRAVVNVKLTKELSKLNDVVINTGVTVRKKELITGAVETFKGSELRQISTQNVVQALKTLDPSFIVVDNSIAGSNPNTLPTIEVRGQTSLSVNQVNSQFKEDPNQPLFILDGFPTTLQQVVDLDMNRIASITLLKDAASTALYGSRSANGIVVIETNKPAGGKLQFSYVYNSSFEFADLSVYNLMDAQQKLEFERLSGAYRAPILDNLETQFRWDKVYNDRLANVQRGVNTYWLNEPIQMGLTSGHSMSVGGGSDAFRFNLAGNYKTMTGTMKGTEHNTWGYNGTLNYRKGKLNFSNDFFVTGGTNQNSPYGTFDIWAKTSPYYAKYNENGVATRFLDGTSTPNVIVNQPTNPLYNVGLSSFDKGNNFNFTNNFALNYDINTHIKTTAALSATRLNSYSTIFVSPENTMYVNDIPSVKGSYTSYEGITNKWNGNIGGTYSNIFNGVHSFNYTMRASAFETKNDSYQSTLRGFPTGVNGNPAFASGYQNMLRPIVYAALVRGVDLTNQINYAYDRRFLFDVTHTISGATNFGTNKKYSPFWGVGFGWNLNNEFKMNEDVVNIFKIRANYGQTGNQNLVGFDSYNVYSYDPNANYFGTGLKLSQLANPNLESQKTKDLSLGIDLAMFRNRFTATLGAYRRETSPQIVTIDLAPSTGVSTYANNVGYIITKGLELKTNYNIIYNTRDNIIWGVGLTATSNTNELGGFNNSLTSLNDAAKKSTSLMRFYDGASTTDLWAVRSLGIDQATGKEVFLKKDGQSTFILDKNDEVKVGNSRPIATGVISTNFVYKNFSAGVYMRYSFGGDVFNTALYDKVENITSETIFDNQDARAFTDRWKNPGDVALFKGIGLTNSTPISSRFIQRNDYISGESIRFGYKVTDRLFLEKCGLSALGVNLFANDFFRVSTIKAERGIEYPFSRIYSFSFNFSF